MLQSKAWFKKTMGLAFKPRLIPSLIAMLVLWVLLSLGSWQLDRAQQKLELSEQYQSRITAEAIGLSSLGERRLDKNAMYWRRVSLQGSYEADKVYLLDNQTLSGRAGNYLFTRFVLTDGSAVMVNRGWLPLELDRSLVPKFTTPYGELTVSGVVKPPPRTLLLGEHVQEQLTQNVVRVQELVLGKIAADNNWQLLPYVVRLDAPAPDGLFRVWQEPGFGRDRHLGYAFQFFAMAAALVIIYFFVTIKRR